MSSRTRLLVRFRAFRVSALALAGADGGPEWLIGMYRSATLRAAVAAYGDDRDDAGLTGREAYLRYGVVALASVEAVGGKILWSTEATGDPIVGCDHDAYDEVVAVWYPSRAAFVRLPEQPGYTDALEHRDAALEQAVLLPCAAFDEQRLGTPWDG